MIQETKEGGTHDYGNKKHRIRLGRAYYLWAELYFARTLPDFNAKQEGEAGKAYRREDRDRSQTNKPYTEQNQRLRGL